MQTGTLIPFLIFNSRIGNRRFIHTIFFANIGPETEHGRGPARIFWWKWHRLLKRYKWL